MTESSPSGNGTTLTPNATVRLNWATLIGIIATAFIAGIAWYDLSTRVKRLEDLVITRQPAQVTSTSEGQTASPTINVNPLPDPEEKRIQAAREKYQDPSQHSHLTTAQIALVEEVGSAAIRYRIKDKDGARPYYDDLDGGKWDAIKGPEGEWIVVNPYGR